MSTKNIFRIHPAIGIARVGNSEEYFIGPETMAGMDGESENDPMGGLPILPNEETKTISSDDLRDADNKLKRQAARFKIYAYDETQINQYPSGAGTEIQVNSKVMINGEEKTVSNIYWQLHLANKKPNSWIEPEMGIQAYESTDDCKDRTPFFRNPIFNGGKPWPECVENQDKETCNSREILGQKERLEKLVIDAGPHVVSSKGKTKALFNNTDQNEYLEYGITGVPSPENIDYPRLFPSYPNTAPENEKIETLGEMHTDQQGRLIVLGGYGKASGFDLKTGDYTPNQALEDAVNNNGWHDDTADGPVNAVLEFTDGTKHTVEGAAWVVVSDPSYAPQVANVVSLWEDMYNTWVEEFNLEPSLYTPGTSINSPEATNGYDLGKGYNLDYAPDFTNQIKPILNAADLQMWATNLVATGQGKHKAVAALPQNNPNWPQLLDFMRNPNTAENNVTVAGKTELKGNNANPQNGTRMPLSLGDEDQDFLNISRTQYFFMYQWLINNKTSSDLKLGAGELLDRNVLGNCLGGRFSPGIEMTFIIRDTHLYKNWKDGDKYTAAGPFRINEEKLDYKNLNAPFLNVGYQPLKDFPVQPGDICKFMSIPWHTDYNSCGTHETINAEITRSNMTYWSWPAQRPVAVYTYNDLVCDKGELKTQRFSVRGEGTQVSPVGLPQTPGINECGEPKNELAVSNVSANVGRYQKYIDFVNNWTKIGTVIQGTNISNPDASIPSDVLNSSFLEVQSLFEEDESNLVVPGPIAANHSVAPPLPMCPHAAKAKKEG